ncbi:hypothetical protein KFK09_000078 [Dendrobium nobile]|uniref:Uncharacterized protein n=1 Tax=Dendrobium nobile TaxID=94219 RepID=A0A8T3C7H8_DENNO|nr:hypothetical protein KFK09_000078 [Dendrobium nobile]
MRPWRRQVEGRPPLRIGLGKKGINGKCGIRATRKRGEGTTSVAGGRGEGFRLKVKLSERNSSEEIVGRNYQISFKIPSSILVAAPLGSSQAVGFTGQSRPNQIPLPRGPSQVSLRRPNPTQQRRPLSPPAPPSLPPPPPISLLFNFKILKRLSFIDHLMLPKASVHRAPPNRLLPRRQVLSRSLPISGIAKSTYGPLPLATTFNMRVMDLKDLEHLEQQLRISTVTRQARRDSRAEAAASLRGCRVGWPGLLAVCEVQPRAAGGQLGRGGGMEGWGEDCEGNPRERRSRSWERRGEYRDNAEPDGRAKEKKFLSNLLLLLLELKSRFPLQEEEVEVFEREDR